MASYQAPAAISQTLRTLLLRALQDSDFADAQVKILRMPQFREQTFSFDKGLSITLYRVAASQLQRNLIRQFDPSGSHPRRFPLICTI